MNNTTETPAGPSLGRRDVLRGALALSFAGPLGEAAAIESGPEMDDRPSGMVQRQVGPGNLEFPFSHLDTGRFYTPNEEFYVRTHFQAPALDEKFWKIAIEGAVERPFEIGLDELKGMPARTLTSLLECSGNGRVFLEPPQLGVRWELGGVGNAEWTGVPLANLLDRAGVKPGAVEVVLEGADSGKFAPPKPKTPGVVPFARSLPLEKARRPEVLLAYKMNGEDLPARHGRPARAIVAGWYGMASVKWLRRIIVVDRPFHGYFQTLMYTVWARRHGLPSLVPVSRIHAKAQIARPAPFEVVPKSRRYRMFGAAWAGEADVARVDVSDDGGKSWARAKLLGEPVPFSWRFWEHEWAAPERPGRCVLMARATDDQGNSQPLKRNEDHRDSVIDHVLPIEIEIR